MKNNLSIKENQLLFQAVLNKFLAKNHFFQGTITAGIGLVVLITLILTLITYWMPILIAVYLLVKGFRKSIPGSKKNLTDLEWRAINLLESND